MSDCSWMGRLLLAGVVATAAATTATGQWYPAGRESKMGPMLDQGLVSYSTPQLKLRLLRSSGTAAALEASDGAGGSFDFTPAELLAARSVDGYYHLGDLDLWLRTAGTSEWKGYSSAHERHQVRVLTPAAGELERDDLRPTMGAGLPIDVERSWAVVDGQLVLRFTLRNSGASAVEVGGLGIPLIFDNIMNGKTLEEAHALCSFADPSIARDGGYVQVTRLNGHGPSLLVLPEGKTPLEAYRPIAQSERRERAIFEEPTPRTMTFEGFYEWMVASKRFSDKEWKGVEEWNESSSFELQPGESRVVGLRFVVAPEVRAIEKTLAEQHRPVAVGLPGYILPQDEQASLFLHYDKPVSSLKVEPEGAIEVQADGKTEHGWLRYKVQGKQWGRARLTITYADGLVQTVAYRTIKPETAAVDDMGRFLFTKQWYVNPKDAFHRSPSPMNYDRESNSIVDQDSRVWIAGLGDEGGSGTWLAAAMKEFVRPDKQQVGQLEEFVDGVLWGGLQYKDGPHAYGVRKSLFYYQPDQMPAGTYSSKIDWGSWTSWSKEASEDPGRSFNYPHVVAAYWALYRVARNHPGMTTHHDWQWYLTHAYETTMAMTRYAGDLGQFGQMEGDVFVGVLEDLKHEGMSSEAAQLEKAMHARAEVWNKLPYPFGSEMPWDSTGQEEVYAWTRYFGMKDKAQATVDAIVGYMPTIPSWGYNGSARRYWDFLYGGKYSRRERQLHHYGSGINAIPVLDAYRRNPADLHLLRIGFGGVTGAIAGIDQEGFASAAFHSWPDKMIFDPLTGDYGPNFFGHAWATSSYLVHDEEFGWQGFGGNVKVERDAVEMKPVDSLRQRVYLAPLGLWLTLDSGSFESVRLLTGAHQGEVELRLAPRDAWTPVARLHIEQTASLPGVSSVAPSEKLATERGAYVVTLGNAGATLRLVPQKVQ